MPRSADDLSETPPKIRRSGGPRRRVVEIGNATRQFLGDKRNTNCLTKKFGNIDFGEINHVRGLLEVPSARDAARNRTESDIETLRGIIDRQKEITLEDPEGPELDSTFHTAIAEASGNRVLASLVFALHSVIRQVLFLDMTAEIAQAVVQQHIAIARGIINGDEEEAAGAMEAHLDYLDRLRVWREKSRDGSA